MYLRIDLARLNCSRLNPSLVRSAKPSILPLAGLLSDQGEGSHSSSPRGSSATRHRNSAIFYLPCGVFFFFFSEILLIFGVSWPPNQYRGYIFSGVIEFQ